MQIIRNEQYLNLAFVPQKLVFREKEIEILQTAIIDPLSSGIGGTAIIYGEPGTGKTATAKFISNIAGDLDYIYLNALSFPSLTSLLRSAVSTFTKLDQVSTYTTGDYLKMLSKIQSRRGRGILLVVDECTNLLREDQKGFYSILRAPEIYSVRMSSILISLDDPYIILRKKRARSVSSYVPVKFSRYSRDELFVIVRDRASEALFSTAFDDSILEMIADIAAQLGSARVAIEMLQKAAFIAKHRLSDQILVEDVRSARALINPYFTESKLNGLDRDELAVLLATAYCLRDGMSAGISSAMERFGIISETYSLLPMDRQKFYRTVSRLETYGLIESRLEGRGDRKGVEKILMINDVPIDSLAEKVESILDHTG